MAAGIRTDKPDQDRFYVDPATRVTVPGVTTVLNGLGKPFLPPWYAKMAAELAEGSFDLLVAMRERAGRQAVIDYIKGAAPRYNKARRELGTEAHNIFEPLIRGEAVGVQRADLEPYRLNFIEFMKVVRPRLLHAEDIVWSDQHAYAGSFDSILEVLLSVDAAGRPYLDLENGTPTIVIGDWKTGKNTHAEVALQLAAYTYADRIIHADGSESPMPNFGGAAVLHITDTKWSFSPVRCDEEVFRYFLLLRGLFDWREFSKDVIGRPLASGGRVATGTERRK